MTKNRILIVEDDKGIADGIAVNLQYSGYDYAVYTDGQEAADALREDHGYDLALLDIMLPGLDGFDLLPHMQNHNIPVIYLTARSDATSEIKGLRGGAEDYITKPFDPLTLLVRIEKVLDRCGKLNKILRVGDIVVDCENHSVQKNGAPIALKPLEYELFTLLARYKNRTLLRERILNEIWGSDYFGDTRTVDVHIANLRRKLAISAQLVTVPKYGYRLED
ncbi:MAG: response regulator transcription factor [Peptococcaceae bacterium]|jgi:DNA-binding response OmpR family regulator|nr:response regulator transcription factor [Peptococcaceae bacterium]MDR2737099.1 response regulator transcription factor [Gracilibacteraceae bacterium]